MYPNHVGGNLTLNPTFTLTLILRGDFGHFFEKSAIFGRIFAIFVPFGVLFLQVPPAYGKHAIR